MRYLRKSELKYSIWGYRSESSLNYLRAFIIEVKVCIMHYVLETKAMGRTYMATDFLIINLPHKVQGEFKGRQDKC